MEFKEGERVLIKSTGEIGVLKDNNGSGYWDVQLFDHKGNEKNVILVSCEKNLFHVNNNVIGFGSILPKWKQELRKNLYQIIDEYSDEDGNFDLEGFMDKYAKEVDTDSTEDE